MIQILLYSGMEGKINYSWGHYKMVFRVSRSIWQFLWKLESKSSFIMKIWSFVYQKPSAAFFSTIIIAWEKTETQLTILIPEL